MTVDAREESFEKYLRSEYDHIAEAHFRTIESISAFFRYYLLIVSVPISLIVLVLTISPKPSDLGTLVASLNPLLATVFLVIAVAAFCVMLYLANLRMDALLYARTVNSIRKHFFDRAPLAPETRLRGRILPQTLSQPSYFEPRYFLPVIGAFAVLNGFYMFAFFLLLKGTSSDAIGLQLIPRNIPWWGWTVSVAFFVLHPLGYAWMAHHREHEYLRSCIMGVDIDGVLNDHRTHFCELLVRCVGKDLSPDAITRIPLHEDSQLGITRDDEKRVFNDPKYWTEMMPVNGAADNLKRLHNAFRLKIHIFTHRPWPNLAGVDEAEGRVIRERWLAETKGPVGRRPLRRIGGWIATHLPVPARTRGWLEESLVETVTRAWLLKWGFCFDRLTVEKGSDDVSDPQGRFKNRFYEARKGKIRFFVEDDAEKAAKLAYVCDVVLLLDQPYNRDSGTPLPGNVIRVQSWDEIYQKIRALS